LSERPSQGGPPLGLDPLSPFLVLMSDTLDHPSFPSSDWASPVTAEVPNTLVPFFSTGWKFFLKRQPCQALGRRRLLFYTLGVRGTPFQRPHRLRSPPPDFRFQAGAFHGVVALFVPGCQVTLVWSTDYQGHFSPYSFGRSLHKPWEGSERFFVHPTVSQLAHGSRRFRFFPCFYGFRRDLVSLLSPPGSKNPPASTLAGFFFSPRRSLTRL